MKQTIALNALIKANGEVSVAKRSVSIRISARTWQKAIEIYRELPEQQVRHSESHYPGNPCTSRCTGHPKHGEQEG